MLSPKMLFNTSLVCPALALEPNETSAYCRKSIIRNCEIEIYKKTVINKFEAIYDKIII